MKRHALLTALATLLVAAACSGTTGPPEGVASDGEGNLTVLGPGEKADNFRSQSAKEYYVSGRTSIELGDDYADLSEEERRQRVEELIPYKQVVIGYFLNTYLVAKSDDAENSDYGDFKALTKNGSYEDMNIRKEGDLTYSFKFVQEVGGQLDLLEELKRRADAEPNSDGSYTFELAVGEVSNQEMTQTNPGRAWFRSSPWADFSTDSVDESKYYWQEIDIRPQERSDDAWIEYERLVEDGTINVGIFFGWDYHDDYHKKHSKAVYQWLVDRGYESPASSWKDYSENRGPMTKTIRVGDQEVDVEITLWWGQPGTETDPNTDEGARRLVSAMEESFRTNEITAFNGHSGPWYGFALANWRETSEGEIDDSEVPDLEMPDDKYQLVLAKGCDTYALGEAFWKNPNKSDEEDLDIITTTSFSNAASSQTMTDLLDAAIGTGEDDVLTAERYSTLLEDLDNNSWWFETMYGVHGIDNNPHAHPFADEGNVCSSCSSNADCGGQGNHCVNMQDSAVCTYECTADDGCPDGFTCRKTRNGSTLETSVCVPSNYSCSTPSSGDESPVVITEVGADPAEGAQGDWNGDGTRDAREDEFVELSNRSSETVDLAGWQIADDVAPRYMFPEGTRLEPGERLVVFGGGDTTEFTGLPEDAVVLSSDGLYLNNGGDSVTILDHENEKVASVDYGDEGGDETSLIRTDDGDYEQAETPTPGREN